MAFESIKNFLNVIMLPDDGGRYSQKDVERAAKECQAWIDELRIKIKHGDPTTIRRMRQDYFEYLPDRTLKPILYPSYPHLIDELDKLGTELLRLDNALSKGNHADALAELVEPLPCFDITKFGKVFAQYWPDVDLDGDMFLAGVSNVSHVKGNGDNQLTITMQSGSKFVWVDQLDGEGREFIGFASSRNAPAPITELQADEIVGLAVARGWSVVTVTGSIADKDKLWLAAKSAGLEVVDYSPTPATRKLYQAMPKDSGGLAAADQVKASPPSGLSKAAKAPTL